MQAGGKVGAERCLYLNVWQPASAAEAGGPAVLPIMFWIHGGAMKSGAGSEYDGTRLASAHGVTLWPMGHRMALAVARATWRANVTTVMRRTVASQWHPPMATPMIRDQRRVSLLYTVLLRGC